MAADPPKNHLLAATYSSPTNEPFQHTLKLPAPPTSKPTDRTAYLGALKKATVELQEQINKELTLRMEEDKAKEAAGASKTKARGVDESKEDDNYGEELLEED